jgi:hypothetical protein
MIALGGCDKDVHIGQRAACTVDGGGRSGKDRPGDPSIVESAGNLLE